MPIKYIRLGIDRNDINVIDQKHSAQRVDSRFLKKKRKSEEKGC